MKSYDISSTIKNRIHTVKATFQKGEYKGHIKFKVCGNCVGLEILNIDFDLLNTDRLIENDCDFSWDDKEGVYDLTLKDKYGETCFINGIEEDEIGDYVVAVKIVNCENVKKQN